MTIFSKKLKDIIDDRNIFSFLYYKLVGYRSRYNYWSCSEFAKQIQRVYGIEPKPGALSSRGWREWEAAAKKASPVGYWITEEGLGIAQDIAYFIPDIYHRIYVIIRNAFITKSYMIDTGLSRTKWHEADTRITEGLFNLLVDFVEAEEAAMYDYSTTGDSDNQPITNRRDAGLAHLDWAISLGEESSYQSEAAKEIKEIYLWIKDTYPNRADPHDVTGWSEYCDNKEFILDNDDESEETRIRVRKMLTELTNLEQLYKDEETDYLTRIVKVRSNMWT